MQLSLKALKPECKVFLQKQIHRPSHEEMDLGRPQLMMFAGWMLHSQISSNGSSDTAQESVQSVKGQPCSFCRSVCVGSFVCNAFTSWRREEARLEVCIQ